tara:strand:+ start:3916 stop:4272 length:357 start_codon:yes stop_codon:yes gene_type:complete
MRNIVYANTEHKAAVETYVNMCKEFAEDVGNKNKYQAYKEVLETIFDYHNSYGENLKGNNFYDWLMIIPINISVMTNGYFAGVQTNKNLAVIRAYRVVLDQILQETVDKIDSVEPTYE